MSARVKAAILIGAVTVMILIGSALGGAVESLGEEINSGRAAAMGR